tara:strand:- start:83 stop:622 length:540 start_codon:yes stop_codon:yes gene_type:complete
MSASRRGQMEVFGLAIILVLFIIALIIFLRLSSDEQQPAEDAFFAQLPTIFLQTTMDTTTNCREQTVETLIRDVASLVSVPSGSDACQTIQSTFQIACSPGRFSHHELGITGTGALDVILATLQEASIPYEFSIRMENLGSCVIYEQQWLGCSDATRIDAETFILASSQGNVEVQLRIC